MEELVWQKGYRTLMLIVTCPLRATLEGSNDAALPIRLPITRCSSSVARLARTRADVTERHRTWIYAQPDKVLLTVALRRLC